MSGQVERHPERRFATAAELAELMDITVHNVHSRAYRAGWRRTETRPVRYLLTDVLASDRDTRRSQPLAP